MTQEHTPTPWQDDKDGDIVCPNQNYELVAHAYDMYADSTDGKTNAAFIVRACNSHAALVEALECERARDYLNAENGSPEMREVCLGVLVKYGYDPKGHETYQAWTDNKTIAALTLAKGE